MKVKVNGLRIRRLFYNKVGKRISMLLGKSKDVRLFSKFDYKYRFL